MHVGLGRGVRLSLRRLPRKGELEGDVKGLRDEHRDAPHYVGRGELSATAQLVYCHRRAQCEVRPRRRGPSVPWYLLLNGTEPRWRLHDTVDSADLEKSLARVMDKGVTTYTLASRDEGETFQSLTINGKHLVTYVIAEEDDPDPAKTRSRYQAAGF